MNFSSAVIAHQEPLIVRHLIIGDLSGSDPPSSISSDQVVIDSTDFHGRCPKLKINEIPNPDEYSH
jgi:hypothetical protein